MRSAAVVLAVLAIPTSAFADVASDVRRVTTGWTDARGAAVPVEERAVFLFPQAAQSVKLETPGCGRLVLIGPMGLSFDAQIVGADPEYRSSFAGVIDGGPLCVGAEGLQVRVATPAGRGAVVVAFGRGAIAAIDVHAMLGRPRPSGPSLGSAPSPPGPLRDGHQRFVTRARREGAKAIARLAATTEEPTFRLPLGPGCYLAEIAAEEPRPGARYDLDAEARVVPLEEHEGAEDGEGAEAERVLATDRSSAAEASLEFCLVASNEVEVRVRGTAGARETRLSYATFPLRVPVPVQLGSTAKNAVERAWRVRGGSMATPVLREAELFGVGLVRRRFAARRGACHVAFATALDGTPRNLSLAIRAQRDEIRQSDVAASVAFCTGSDGAVDVEVDSRGAAPGVAFLLFEVGS